jgi:NAD(P)-dependent dehydrogenase (short-subunit alcohol dehydrogenase family)
MSCDSGGKGVALITGGARRLGAAFARALAEDGYAVGLHCLGAVDEADRLADALCAEGHRAAVLPADLSDPEAASGLIDRCREMLGPVTVLVNSAARFVNDSAAGFSAEDFSAHVGPNLLAPLLLVQRFAAALPADAKGCVVNLLDHKVTALNPDFFTYTVSKVGLAGATRMLAMAYAGRVRVNGIAPGITLISGRQTPEGFARAWRAPPLGRSTTPEELVIALRFIVRTESLNGQMLVLDGGESLVGRKRDVAFLV